jgi:hypothetical protein
VPNVVWLPSEVAKLTDREASFVQSFTQALSVKIYRDVRVDPKVAPIVGDAWAMLPVRDSIPEQGLPQLESLNFFQPAEGWMKKRLDNIRTVASALDAVANGRPLETKNLSTRYAAGLPALPPSAASSLRDRLLAFLD